MRTAITIGTFDGVHLGHQALVQRCTQFSRQHYGKTIVLAFDPHPMTKLRPDAAPPRLVTWQRKAELLHACGADDVVRLEPTSELLGKTGDEFLRWLFHRFTPSWIVEGNDFHYGKARDGNIRTLEAFAAEIRGDRRLASQEIVQVEVVPPVEVVLGDHQFARASSTLVRWLVSHGRVSDAARVLGREYELEGTVVMGDRKGRTIGVPTCNLATECLLPMDGVYAGRAVLPSGESFSAAVAVGARPTVGGLVRRAEIHILPDESNVAPGEWSPLPGVEEYGWHLRVALCAFVRDEVKFPSFGHLREQIARDLGRVRVIMRARNGGVSV